MLSRYFLAVPVAHPNAGSDRDIRADYLCRWHRQDADWLAAMSHGANSPTQPTPCGLVHPVPVAHPMPWVGVPEGLSIRAFEHDITLSREIALLRSGGVPVAHPGKIIHLENPARHLCRRHTPAPSYRFTAAETRSSKARLAEDLSDSGYRGLISATPCPASWGVPVAHPAKGPHRENRESYRHLCRWHRSAALAFNDVAKFRLRSPNRLALKWPPVPPALLGWEPGWTTVCNLVRELRHG